MVTAAPRRVRITARENSVLYHLQLQFNLALAWALTLVHNGAIGNPPTPTLPAAGIKQIGMVNGKNVDGAALSQSGANLIVSYFQGGRAPGQFEYNAILAWNLWYDLGTAHGHTGLGGGPLTNPPTRLANLESRDPSGDLVVTPPSPSPLLTKMTRREGTDEAEYVEQWNHFAEWYWQHAHAALGAAANTPPSDSGAYAIAKIANYDGRDVAGAVVVV
jgi:hypothetical protein